MSLCKKEATLRHADKVFRLLLRDLQVENSELADKLYEQLRLELQKRRTLLSSTIAILADPTYDFDREREIGVDELPDEEIISILVEIGGVTPTPVISIARQDGSLVGFLLLFISVSQ